MLPFISFVLDALYFVIFADVILSWVMPNREAFPRSFTSQITDPLYAPIRALIDPRKLGGLDLSPLIVLMLLSAMSRMLRSSLGPTF